MKIKCTCPKCSKAFVFDTAEAQIFTDMLESDEQGRHSSGNPKYVAKCPNCGAENRVAQKGKP